MAPLLKFDSGSMVFPTMSRWIVTRLLAALFVLLVISPYTEPFATIHGTDSARAGAIDVDGPAKSKTGSQDGLASPPMVTVVVDLVVVANRPVSTTVPLDSPDHQRAILRQ
jgi:hypothetical protein